MSNDVERMFASLAQDAGRAQVDPPATLRRRSDRRTAVRSVASVAAVAVLVTGVAVGSRVVLAGNDRAPAPPAGTATPAPTPTVALPTSPVPTSAPSSGVPTSAPPATARSSEPPSIPDSVPARAFLSAAEVNATETPERRTDRDMLPELCGADFATGSIGVRSNRYAAYHREGDPADYTPLATVDQTVTVYRAEGAQTFVDEVRSAVERCRTQTRGQDVYQHRLLDAVRVGDESVLVEVSAPQRGDDGELSKDGGRQRAYCAVVRVRDTVTVLWVRGWESQSPERAGVDSFTRKAVQRLQAWRG